MRGWGAEAVPQCLFKPGDNPDSHPYTALNTCTPIIPNSIPRQHTHLCQSTECDKVLNRPEELLFGNPNCIMSPKWTAQTTNKRAVLLGHMITWEQKGSAATCHFPYISPWKTQKQWIHFYIQEEGFILRHRNWGFIDASIITKPIILHNYRLYRIIYWKI